MTAAQDRCPNCGRFVEFDADGFYDREIRCDERSLVLQFCHESCADHFHRKKRQRLVADCLAKPLTQLRALRSASGGAS